MLQTFFSKSTLKGHSKSTPRALGHSGTPRALKALGQLGTRALEALGHSRLLGTWALRNLGTQALEGHLGIQALEHSRHFI